MFNVLDLNDYCETDDDCNNIKYTYCTVNNKCSCLANYIEVDGSCTGLVGEKCSDDDDCAVDNSKCEATVCQCDVDFYLSTNKDRCYPFASRKALAYCLVGMIMINTNQCYITL